MKALLNALPTLIWRHLLRGGYARISAYLPFDERQGALITLPARPVPLPADGFAGNESAIHVRLAAGQPPRRLARG